MSFSMRFWLLMVSALLSSGLASAQSERRAQTAKPETPADQGLPKSFACPRPSALGNVSLHIMVDTKGNVSEAKALSGPQELFPAAESCARTWKYENPPSNPVLKTVTLRYESRDCPAAESQRGEVQFSWGLRDRFNHPVAYVQGAEPPPPAYPEEERKAGIAGTMLLSVPLNVDGSVKDIRVLQGLSPALDKEVMDQLRPLKFKIADGASQVQVADALFRIVFHATCWAQTVSNEN